jgi:hypothetical protein
MKMKNKMLFLGLLMFAATLVQAQLRLGIKAGLSTNTINTSEIDFTSLQGVNTFGVNVKNASYGPHFGVVLRYNMDKWHIQPEILLNSNKIDYNVKDLTKPSSIDSIKTDKFQYLDIPLLLGYDFGFMRLHGGPVGHVLLAHSTTLTDLNGYSEDFSKMTFGYQAGVGFDLWKLNIDLRYEGNFTKFGDHFNFFGKQVEFSKSPARLMASVGFMF